MSVLLCFRRPVRYDPGAVGLDAGEPRRQRTDPGVGRSPFTRTRPVSALRLRRLIEHTDAPALAAD